MKKSHAPVHQIEVRISQLSELFNSMDPTPFHHRDLDTDAEEFLESWAMEFPRGSHYRILVHIENMPDTDPTPVVAEAIHNYFDYKSVLTRRNLVVLLREGRTSLLIGLCFLALCLLGADVLSSALSNPFLRALRESLVIGGWVAMWRPMQIFLYEWWPLLRRSTIYRNLAHANVHVLPAKVERPVASH
ncbi:MAG TPA: hypothetical protein VFW68_02355 [Rhodocyclaceae bacterium]|nr:hypothetical protein [Rhodocyclaceae bacterium]